MKAHLKDSDSPIVLGRKVTANCGQEIPNTAFVFLWDEGFEPSEFLNGLQICRKCLEIPRTSRYVYGVVNAQEIRTHGDSDAS